MPRPKPTTASILTAWDDQERDDLDRLVSFVYHDLRNLAQQKLRGERQEHTLQPTALVNEAYLRLLAMKRFRVTNKNAFFALAARMMRRILVEHARRKRATKRGHEFAHVDHESTQIPLGTETIDVLDLDRLLTRLSELDEKLAELVELRVFTGMTLREIATLPDWNRNQVAKSWSFAKRWLAAELGEQETIP